MPLRTTLPYAVVLAALYLVLSARVIARRNAANVAIGVGGDATLERRVRVHANFAEYAPFALLLMAMAELADAPAWTVNAAGLLLVAGRVVHAYGVSQPLETIRVRVAGMIMTLGAIGGLAVLLALLWVRR